MATSVALPSRPPAVQENLQDALNWFQKILDDDQRQKVLGTRDVPSLDKIMVFTAELDVGSFCAIVDTYVSANPEIAALVWGSIKLTIMITMNFVSYYDFTSELFMKLGRQCPLLSEYQTLYPESTRLQQSINDFYASIIRCCKHLVETMQRSSLRMSFDQEFKPDLEDVERLGSFVNKEISLAKAQADLRHQQEQTKEQREAAMNRSFMNLFVSRTDHNLDKLQSGQVQRQSRKERARYLDSLSTYDYMRSFKQSNDKRYGNTTKWVLEMPQFHRWLTGKSSILWCSGKIGSGKTVVTASVIQQILRLKGDPKSSIGPVSFFFVQSDDEESTSANSILRSLLRQRLEGVELPSTMQGKSALTWSDISDLFMQYMPSPQTSFIFIDGLDECDKDRKKLLKELSVISSTHKSIRIFLASRLSLRDEIKTHFTNYEHLTLDCEATQEDISSYIEGILGEKLEVGDFKIGDQSLLYEIKSKLVQGADGMWVPAYLSQSEVISYYINRFLWAFFQLDTIFSLHCDDDIRHALDDLPIGLAETFQRALRRIEDGHHGPAARKVFPWIAASKRPLSLGELQEATAIEVGQKFTIPGRLFNDMEKIASWCQNLVFVDEETQFIQFTHLAVKMFLLDESTKSMSMDFHITLEEADHMLGEICVTYLGFNDFKTTLAKRPKAVIIDPFQILPNVFIPGSKLAAIVSSLKLRPQTRKHDLTPSITGPLRDSTSSFTTLEVMHPFLKYASVYWIIHSASFQETESTTWMSWKSMATQGHPLAQIPWQGKLPNNKDDVLYWSYQCNHYAIIRLLISHYNLTTAQKNKMLEISTKDKNINILDIFLHSMQSQEFDYAKDQALQAAAKGGHLEVVNRLLAAKANVNALPAYKNRRTALQAAAEGGHLDVVDRLLAAKADVNAQSAQISGWTALQAASKGGHLEVVDRLLAAKADVNAQPAQLSGWTALRAAAEGGHFEVVDRLLAAKAVVNIRAFGHPTVLQAAAKGGHLKVVDRLLVAKAEVNVKAIGHPTALQAAAEGGHLEVVDRLLAAKADVNAPSAQISGWTALQAASKGGHLEVVDRLLAAKADVNAQAAQVFGRTALQAAAEQGHLKVIDRLLAAGADVNAVPAQVFGRTALQAAAEQGHLKVIDRLLAAGADVNALPAHNNGRTVLQAASEGGHPEVVDRLLAAKADVNAQAAQISGWTALQAAAKEAHFKVIDKLLAAKADVNALPAFENGRMALQAAAEGGHLEVVDRLLAAKADVNAVPAQIFGRTALQAASEGGHLEMVNRLLAAKADVNALPAEIFGRTALQAAAEGGHLKVVNRLLAVGADVNAPAARTSGRTALGAAAEGGHIEIVERLEKAGAL